MTQCAHSDYILRDAHNMIHHRFYKLRLNKQWCTSLNKFLIIFKVTHIYGSHFDIINSRKWLQRNVKFWLFRYCIWGEISQPHRHHSCCHAWRAKGLTGSQPECARVRVSRDGLRVICWQYINLDNLTQKRREKHRLNFKYWETGEI